MPAFMKAPRYRVLIFFLVALYLYVSHQFLRVRCEKWLLAVCCVLAAVSVWQLMVLQGEVAAAKERVVQAAQQQVMTFLTSNLPQQVRQWFSYLPEDVAFLNDLDQNDLALINHIRRRALVPPANPNVPYSLKKRGHPNNSTMIKTLLKIFVNKTDGFFVEGRALDGEGMSVTLELEKDKKWQGLLIEPDPSMFLKLLATNRKSWLAPTCLSHKKTPLMTKVTISGLKRGHGSVDVHCHPLAALLNAMNRTVVDLLRLDLNGDEINVLKTFPFDSMYIAAISVKFSHGRTRKETLKEFIEKNGYVMFKSNGTVDTWAEENYLFVKEESGLPKN